ncbi:MAG: hypothetical protein COA42_08980 [Alteromonadaceae bacterium]|nr:MAG: hypothetical protein COA42_08980 [Alteromonadaceae bacterium]
MSWYVHGEFPVHADLQRLHKLLDQKKIPHRFTEERGKQWLWVASKDLAPSVDACMGEAKKEEARSEQAKDPTRVTSDPGSADEPDTLMSTLSDFMRNTPLTFLTLLLGVLGYVLVRIVAVNEWINVFYFFPVEYLWQSGQYWRMLSPTFLHMSELHILFNGMFIVFTGARLERVMGAYLYLVVFLSVAIGANFIQFYLTGSWYFGGLSGVVFGYLGFLAVLNFRPPVQLEDLQIPTNVYVQVLIMLVLGFTGVFSLVGLHVANWAHLGGGILGVLVAVFMRVVRVDVYGKHRR